MLLYWLNAVLYMRIMLQMDETQVVGLNTSLLINSHIAIMTINKSKDQKTSFKEAYMNLLLT